MALVRLVGRPVDRVMLDRSSYCHTILRKRQPEGAWLLDNSFVGRMHAVFGRVGEPNRWITLRALKCLLAIGAGV